MLKKISFFLLCCVLFGACSTTSPIQKANESKSAFFFDNPKIVTNNIPEAEQYRIYHRAATGLEYGAADYVSKPYDHAELLARVAVHVRMKMIVDELVEKNRILEELVKMKP